MSDRRLAYLDAMGIQSWARRVESMSPAENPLCPPLQKESGGDSYVDHFQYPGASPDAQMPATSGILPRAALAHPCTSQLPDELKRPSGDTEASTPIALLDWATMRTRVANCTACGLHQGRTQTVFGVGDNNAQWMVIGEAPGAEEDRQGEPFVGRAGQLLNAMLLAIGLQREEVYIANVVKCRPPGNRDPAPEEAAACEPYLKRQIALIKPKVILVVGRIAAHNLLKTDAALGTLRGKHFSYADTGIPVVVTYHPAYLLRSPREKRKAWEDLQFAQKVFAAVPARPGAAEAG